MALTLVTPPAAEPIELAEAKLHLRVDGTDEDALITAAIVAARQHAEDYTGRALLPQTWEQTLDSWPWGPHARDRTVYLQRAPLVAVEWVKYVDEAGALQTWDSALWQAPASSGPGRLRPAYGECFPAIRCGDLDAVTIRFEAGYADAASIPRPIIHGILVLLTTLYEARGADLVEPPAASKRLWDHYRVGPL
jgi:uncharacterized phiE125 gp8 family phage protein